ncbi:MAG: hypothetical protein A2277_18210 [Desulfobacterales bacterium RIFOXYA12_FULL_46_15]|nr:MAG: hypothetical protein A2277_18210 [Desulfobacterales bacterium RIFOXYA12_FULL_46_15]
MNKKKALAAVAAVMMVMKTKEEEAEYSAPEIKEPEPKAAVIAQPMVRPLNIWGISGRQDHMQANSMMQLRMFK